MIGAAYAPQAGQDTVQAVSAMLADFRDWAYSVSTPFGQGVDSLIARGATLGDPAPTQQVTLSSILDSLSSGLQNLATSVGTSAQNYYDALTRVQNMQRANQQGLSLQDYLNATGAARMVAAGSSVPNPNPFNASLFGLPVWVFFAAGAFILVLNSQSRRKK